MLLLREVGYQGGPNDGLPVVGPRPGRNCIACVRLVFARPGSLGVTTGVPLSWLAEEDGAEDYGAARGFGAVGRIE